MVGDHIYILDVVVVRASPGELFLGGNFGITENYGCMASILNYCCYGIYLKYGC